MDKKAILEKQLKKLQKVQRKIIEEIMSKNKSTDDICKLANASVNIAEKISSIAETQEEKEKAEKNIQEAKNQMMKYAAKQGVILDIK